MSWWFVLGMQALASPEGVEPTCQLRVGLGPPVNYGSPVTLRNVKDRCSVSKSSNGCGADAYVSGSNGWGNGISCRHDYGSGSIVYPLFCRSNEYAVVNSSQKTVTCYPAPVCSTLIAFSHSYVIDAFSDGEDQCTLMCDEDSDCGDYCLDGYCEE